MPTTDAKALEHIFKTLEIDTKAVKELHDKRYYSLRRLLWAEEEDLRRVITETGAFDSQDLKQIICLQEWYEFTGDPDAEEIVNNLDADGWDDYYRAWKKKRHTMVTAIYRPISMTSTDRFTSQQREASAMRCEDASLPAICASQGGNLSLSTPLTLKTNNDRHKVGSHPSVKDDVKEAQVIATSRAACTEKVPDSTTIVPVAVPKVALVTSDDLAPDPKPIIDTTPLPMLKVVPRIIPGDNAIPVMSTDLEPDPQSAGNCGDVSETITEIQQRA